MTTEDFTPSPQQQALLDAVQNGRRNLILEARAGTGKTFTLVMAAKRMKGSVYLGAYNAKIGKELKERVAGFSNIRAGTLHAAGYSALRYAFKDRMRGDPTDKKVPNIIESMLQTGELPLSMESVAGSMAAIVSMAKQRGIGVLEKDGDVQVWRDMVEHFGLDDGLPEGFTDDQMLMLLRSSRTVLLRSNRVVETIDFDDMVYLPLVYDLRMFGNDWVLIDEAQDTNPVRRALARKMLKPGGRLIAVGDPYQAIYGFSGADNDALDQIRHQFDCDTLPLTVTYRCPRKVVEVAQQWVPDIEAHESAPDGLYSSYDYKEDFFSQVKPGDAVLCRYNKYLVGTCFRLIRMGVPARIEGRDIGRGLINLATKWKVKSLDMLVTRVNAWIEREVNKANLKKNDRKAAEIADRGETLLVIIQRCLDTGITTFDGMVNLIEQTFDDRVVDRKNMVTLCSVHKSKGMEWPRVFVLGLYELMGRECRIDWQTQQELNLQYVAATRAQEELIDVYGVKEEKKQHELEEA